MGITVCQLISFMEQKIPVAIIHFFFSLLSRENKKLLNYEAKKNNVLLIPLQIRKIPVSSANLCEHSMSSHWISSANSVSSHEDIEFWKTGIVY